jgi:GT2 family glycosyltransferase
MNISIIIPNYNGEKLLRKNLPSVLEAVHEYKEGKVEIIIPDDPSTDKSAKIIDDFIQFVREKNISVKTVSNKNRNEAGFSKNIQRGVSLATGDVLILINSDVRPHKNFLFPLLSHFADPKIFAVACMDESRENGQTVLRGRGIGRFKKGFLMHKEGKLDKQNTLWASGGSSAFRKSTWDKLRGLDILYNPFYWEDIDLSYRALKSGYNIIFEAKSVVIHEHEEGAIKNKFKPVQIQKIAYRNQFIFVWKNITDPMLLLSHVFWLPYHLVNAARRKDKAFFIGFYLALLQFSRVMKERERVKKTFIISDKKILKEHCE